MNKFLNHFCVVAVFIMAPPQICQIFSMLNQPNLIDIGICPPVGIHVSYLNNHLLLII